MAKFKVRVLLFSLIVCQFSSIAYSEFEVRVICFKTVEAKDIDKNKYQDIFREIQVFFKNEMARHGFGEKTVGYELNNDGYVKIHTITGKYEGDHYTGQTFRSFYDKISKEIPFEINAATNLKAQDYHYIVILAGIPLVDDGRGNGYIGNGWKYACWNENGDCAGGVSIVNSQYELGHQGKHYKSLIIHELAHTFGLTHSGLKDELTGPLPYEFPEYIEVPTFI